MTEVIGFTGTRNGMTDAQRECVAEVLMRWVGTDLDVIGLHGDCIGADADFDAVCKRYLIGTHVRPCTYRNLRAYCHATQDAEPVAPMQRNRDIVAAADCMIACPPNDVPIKRGSGTWATIRMALKAQKLLAIVYPDGHIEEHRWQGQYTLREQKASK